MRILDMHCDTIMELMDREDISLRKNGGMLDLEKMRQGDYLLQCFAMFVPYLSRKEGENYSPFRYCHRMIDRYYREIEKNADLIRPVTTVREIRENMLSGRLSALLTVEEGGVCLGSLELLRNFYRLGVRMMTLTWNFKNELAYPNIDYTPKPSEEEQQTARNSRVPETEHGLTETGKEFVREMNRLGIIIDCSHLGDAGFYDVIRLSDRPVVCSHSCARALCGHVRNMTDDMLDRLKENGGVVGINYCPDFVTDEQRPVTVSDLADHIEYIRSRIGVEHIGFGSDFDGISNERLELKDASFMPRVIEELERRGFSDREIDMIGYENALRVFEKNFGC